jgi:thiamine biosynthesis lipoprotein
MLPLPPGSSVDIDPEIAALLKGAADAATRGENLFNPAAGALIAAWGFHADEFRPQRPDDAALAAMHAARPRDVRSGHGRSARRRPSPEQPQCRSVQLDLGGYAKGYALDRAAALLRARGVSQCADQHRRQCDGAGPEG